MSLTLGFHGGAGTVTGSKFLLDADGKRLLIDCGLFQGLKELRLMNWRPLPFRPASIGAVVLTHAHIDHSGYLPRLVREGYRGPIHCTPATGALVEILLLDAARLQQEDADYANRKGFSKHHPALPLFTEADAIAVLRQLRPVEHERWFEPAGIRTCLRNAGHILGSTFVELAASTDSSQTTIVFSGDVGRYAAPLHPDPDSLPDCETLVLESTYGDRIHDPTPLIEQIREPFRQTIARGGIILIPAFAVARAQLVTLLLAELIESGELPPLPIHIDSPMAVDVTEIYSRYLRSDELDAPALSGHLFPRDVQFHRTVGESQQLNHLKGPRVIISSSGMLTGGRVLHHLFRLLPDPSNLLVLAGFQAAGTRGRALIEGAKTLRIHGEDVPVRCRFLAVDGLSAHADSNELMRWLHSGQTLPRNVFLTHGEPQAAAALASRILADGLHAEVPQLGQEFTFDPKARRWAPALQPRSRRP
jgi:Predicted exonuclease of the beta-lactamase fold involved in RNA processing